MGTTEQVRSMTTAGLIIFIFAILIYVVGIRNASSQSITKDTQNTVVAASDSTKTSHVGE